MANDTHLMQNGADVVAGNHAPLDEDAEMRMLANQHLRNLKQVSINPGWSRSLLRLLLLCRAAGVMARVACAEAESSPVDVNVIKFHAQFSFGTCCHAPVQRFVTDTRLLKN
jgi:hypothetical protein